MISTSRRFARILMLAMLLLIWLISMTGCSKRYVIIDGKEMIQIEKRQLDELYSDRELLLNSLEDCQCK